MKKKRSDDKGDAEGDLGFSMVSRRSDPGIGEEDSIGANTYQDKYHGDTD